MTARSRPAATLPLLVALTGAVAVRAALAGADGARSVPGSLTFAAILVPLAVAGGARLPRRALRQVAVGAAAAVTLAVPALLHAGIHATLPASDLPAWTLLTVVVAGAEEAFLRGALYDAVARRRGESTAIVVAAAAFALLHVPFYGWGAVPVDLAVGLLLGVARLLAGSWAAPAVAHVTADLVGWWTL